MSEVAEKIGAPFMVLDKIRRGDNDVEVSVPDIEPYMHHTPVLVDDIISTAHTMIEAVRHLKSTKIKAPVCVGVHGVFAGNAYDDLAAAGANKIITCNTIGHFSNAIDLSSALSESIKVNL